MRRLLVLCCALAAAAATTASAAAPWDPAAVPAGVSAGGVDLSGLPLAAAEARLQAELGPKLGADFVLGAAGRRWTLTAAEAEVQFDALTTAKRALRAKAPGAVPLAVRHTHRAVAAWLAGVAAKVARPARDARVKITLRHIYRRRGKHGKALDAAAVARKIDAALDDPDGIRSLHVRLKKTSPQVNMDDLKHRYGTVVTVDRAHFKLRLFKGLKFKKSYMVAVGQPAYPTPTGLFAIQDKQVNPTWSVPNSPWAGELQGTTVEGGSAANPLKARWMGITDGVGIHGTGEDYSIGSAASHGCIRMHVSDVIDLYPRVPVGASVLIK